MSRIYFIRHGQASYLADNYDKLSPKGEEQSQKLRDYFHSRGIAFSKLYTGPLQRQIKTLEISTQSDVSSQTGIPVKVTQEMREHDGPRALRLAYDHLVANDNYVGQLEKEIRNAPELRRKNSLKIFEHFIVRWMTGEYNLEHPEVQPWLSFRESVQNGIKTLLSETERGDTVGVFTSGGTISAIVADALGVEDQAKVAELNFLVRNTSITQFEYSRNKFNLLSFNELPHLPNELITYV